MTIEVTRQEQSDILVALRAAQDAIRSAYQGVQDRASAHDLDHPTLKQLYAVRDSLMELEQPILALDTI